MTKKANLKLMTVAMMVVLIGAGSAWADLTDGLVAHWKLDGDAIDSAGSNDGTIYGAIPTTGQIDGALSFDGSGDYVELPDNEPVWLPQNNFTLSAWAYFERDIGIVDYILDLNAAGSSNPANMLGYAMQRAQGTGKLSFFMFTVANSAERLISNDILEKNKWYHLVAVRDGTTQVIYIDGQLDASRTCSADPIDFVGNYDNDKVSIGRFSRSGNPNAAHFNGKIDDVRIYDRALSAKEVKELYRGQLLSFEIIGPGEVAEDSQTQYRAIADYELASDVDVTDLAEWSVDPNDNCGIAAGILTTEMVDLPTDVTVTAQYSEDDVDESAEKDVSIFAICPSGSALDFDGVDDYVDCGNDDSLDISDSVSLTGWVRFERLLGYQCILAKRGAETDKTANYAFRTGNESNSDELEFYYHDGTAWHVYTTSGADLTVDEWYHVAATFEFGAGTSVKCYVNGTLIESGSWTWGNGNALVQTNTKPITIGALTDKEKLDGLIDEVGIYNRALSAEEVQALMYTRPDMGDSSLVAYWDFDEGQGQEAGDSAGGNDGVLGSTGSIDDNDPNWADSGALMACTLDGLVERNISNVMDIKMDILDLLNIALGKEDALLDYMDEAFHNGQLDNLKKGDVVKAKQKILGAIQAETQAETAVDNSIEKLDDALDTLGIE